MTVERTELVLSLSNWSQEDESLTARHDEELISHAVRGALAFYETVANIPDLPQPQEVTLYLADSEIPSVLQRSPILVPNSGRVSLGIFNFNGVAIASVDVSIEHTDWLGKFKHSEGVFSFKTPGKEKTIEEDFRGEIDLDLAGARSILRRVRTANWLVNYYLEQLGLVQRTQPALPLDASEVSY